VIHPRIVLPVESLRTLSPPALRHVFLHELAHVRSADVLVNWLVIAARAAHWFNPLARHALRQFVADRELVRDQMAIDALDEGPDGRRAYGHTLLELAESISRPRLSPGLSPLIHSEKEIHRRITMITSPTPTPLRWPFHCSLAAALLGVSALTFTAATGQDQPVPAPVPRPAPEVPKPGAPPSSDALPRLPETPPQPIPPGAATGAPANLPAPGGPPAAANAGSPAAGRPPTPGAPAPATKFRLARGEDRLMTVEVREHALKELQERLDQLDAELAEIRTRAEKSAEAGRKRPELQQDESALNRVREEIAAQYYRQKYGLGSNGPVPGGYGKARAGGGGVAAVPVPPGASPSTPYPADRARGVRVEDDGLREEVRDLRDQVGKLARVVEDMQRSIESFRQQPAPSATTLEDARKRRDAEAAEFRKLDAEEAELQAKLIDIETAAAEAEGDQKKRTELQRAMAEIRKSLLRLQVERNARERVRN
jgi:hypothetical protein